MLLTLSTLEANVHFDLLASLTERKILPKILNHLEDNGGANVYCHTANHWINISIPDHLPSECWFTNLVLLKNLPFHAFFSEKEKRWNITSCGCHFRSTMIFLLSWFALSTISVSNKRVDVSRLSSSNKRMFMNGFYFCKLKDFLTLL